MTDRERLFFGVPLTEEARKLIHRTSDDFPASLDSLRRVPAANLHLTLRFLGATTADQKQRVEAALKAERLPSAFPVRITGWGAFPRVAAARIMWAGIFDPEDGLSRLNAVTERCARLAGFPSEERNYTAHLTLGRFRAPTDLRAVLPALPEIQLDIRIDRFVLFRSNLGPSQANYEELGVYPLL